MTGLSHPSPSCPAHPPSLQPQSPDLPPQHTTRSPASHVPSSALQYIYWFTSSRILPDCQGYSVSSLHSSLCILLSVSWDLETCYLPVWTTAWPWSSCLHLSDCLPVWASGYDPCLPHYSRSLHRINPWTVSACLLCLHLGVRPCCLSLWHRVSFTICDILVAFV